MILDNIDALHSALAAHNEATTKIMRGLVGLSKAQRRLFKDDMTDEMKADLVAIADESLSDIDFKSYATTHTEDLRIFQATEPEQQEEVDE